MNERSSDSFLQMKQTWIELIKILEKFNKDLEIKIKIRNQIKKIDRIIWNDDNEIPYFVIEGE